jgi:protein transport protein SEC39
LKAFPETLANFYPSVRIEHLIIVTHAVGEYRLVLKHGEPFTPVALRVHGDPISIIGRILEQNPKSYTKINDFVWMGKELVKAGLTFPKTAADSIMDEQQSLEHQSIAERRVVAMCISAALAEDDFETAYSYVTARLAAIAGQAHAGISNLDRRGDIFVEPTPAIIDDWSWKAALEAGRYRRTSQTTKPTHLGNASGNPEIRHLQQRMDCLSHALRFAPKSTLQEILNAYRRCEEELDTLLKLEAEEEDAWDTEGDGQTMPGGFGAAKKITAASSRTQEEAPMSLFDLSRASMARAQSGFSALTSVQTKMGSLKINVAEDSLNREYSATQKQSMRKRDQLKNVATGALASGVGWLIGATPSQPTNSGDESN